MLLYTLPRLSSFNLDRQKAFLAKRAISQGIPINTEQLIPFSAKAIPILSRPKVKLLAFDFIPIGTDDYNLNWPGPPRRKLTWADVKFYRPEVEIDVPAPSDITFFFWIKADRGWWPDPTLGFFSVKILKDRKTPRIEDISCPSASGSGKPPQNAPPEGSIGSFWLGCTKKGKVRGNEGKDNDRHARVYMECFDLIVCEIPLDWSWENDQSPRHTVRCC